MANLLRLSQSLQLALVDADVDDASDTAPDGGDDDSFLGEVGAGSCATAPFYLKKYCGKRPWPWGSSRKAGRGARGHEERDGDGLEDEEWASDRSSPFLRWLGSARLALCGPKSADGSTVTMVFVFAQIAYFLVVLLVINAPTKKDPGHAPALLGPSRCAMLGSGAPVSANLNVSLKLQPGQLRMAQLGLQPMVRLELRPIDRKSVV